MDPQIQRLFKEVPAELLTPPVLALVFTSLLLLLTGIGLNIYFIVVQCLRPPDWRALAEETRNRPWTLLHVLIILTIFFVLHLAWIWAKPPATLIGVLVIGTLMCQGMSTAVILGRVLLNRQLSFIQCFGNRTLRVLKSIQYGATGYVATLPLVVFGALISKVCLPYFGIPPEKQDLVLKFIDPACPLNLKFTIAFLAIAVAPATEELLFRGVVLPGLAKFIPMGWAVAIVSLLFGILHYNAFSILPISIMGAAFSIAYIRTGSLLVPIIMHTAFNTMSIVALLVLGDAASVLGWL